jgi:glycosyltransferase involved in cell wall biosynthesis
MIPAVRTVTVVIPCRNEERNLPHVLNAIPSIVTDVIIVDGESTDETVRVAKESRSGVKIIGQHAPGKGAATLAGVVAAVGDITILMDGDDSMDPREIENMVDALMSGADFVHGSRELAGGGSSDFTSLRRLGNVVLRTIVNGTYRVRWTDLTYGYVGFWSDVVPYLGVEEFVHGPSTHLRDEHTGENRRPVSYGHGFEVEVLLLCRAAQLGFTITEVPSFEHKRRHGTSNLHAAKDGARVLFAIAHERLARRHKIRSADLDKLRSARSTSPS